MKWYIVVQFVRYKNRRSEMETNIWLKNYDEGTPHSLAPYPEITLLDIVRETAKQRPDHPALIFKGAQISISQLERFSNALGRALITMGIKKGERISLIMPNCPQFVISQLGAWKAGAVVVPLNPLYTGSELTNLLNDCAVETVIVLTPFYEELKKIQPMTSIKRVIATNIKEYLSPSERILFTTFMEKKDGHRISLEMGDYWLKDLIHRNITATTPVVEVDPHDPALFMYTGGTTGTPKAAIGTHQMLIMTAMQVKAWFGDFFLDWEDVVIGNMPLFHAYGNVAILSASLVGHHPLALIPNPRDLDDLLETIQKVRPALLSGVPTLFVALLHHPKIVKGEIDIRSIKLCFSAAAPLMADTKARFEALTGGRIVEGYALTESMVAAVVSPVHGEYKPGSVGLPLPDVEVLITDPERGNKVLPLNQVGEILIRAPQLMLGYWDRPEETARMIRDGWLFTGDLGYMDEDGYLFIVDRIKDLIKPSGYQVWPREVEEVIASHPAVAEVGVAGVSDDLRGEVVKAWVVLRDGQEITASDIRTFCKQRLAAYKVPRQVEFRSELPKSLVGKVLRRELVREQELSRSTRQAVQEKKSDLMLKNPSRDSEKEGLA
jgi:long-chain acyl-CoA synthetase